MIVKSVSVVIAAAALGIGTPAQADHSDVMSGIVEVFEGIRSGPHHFTFDWENDSFLFRDSTDKSYTNGTRLVLRSASTKFERVDSRKVEGGLDEEREDIWRRYVYGMRLGQNMYTPMAIRLPADGLSPNDRPYAGWAYVGALKDTYWSDGNGGRYLRLALDIGCTGPCSGAEHMQKGVHRILNAVEPLGWNSQIRNELAIQSTLEYSPYRRLLGEFVDLAPYVKGQLGNVFINVGGGVYGRFGRFNSPFGGTVHTDHAPSRVAEPLESGKNAKNFEGLSSRAKEKARDALIAKHSSELFLFGRIESRMVGYNATLQGGWFSKSPRTVEPERLVVDSEWGVAYATKRWSITYSVTTRGNEIKNNPFAVGTHKWGRVQLTWLCD